MAKNLEYYWYNKHFLTAILLPISWLFRILISIRKLLYRLGVFSIHSLPVPVVVVGNISVGGTGKTPFVVWLVERLKEAGYRPGLVSRGYGGQAKHWPQQVRPDSDTRMVGDEAVLLARRCSCPMSVGPQRAAGAKALLAHTDVNIIVSDDGLQHYALGRDVEIVIVDGVRRFGNRQLLPAGPLREPVGRLATVDYIVTNGVPGPREYAMTLKPGVAINLADRKTPRSLAAFKGQEVHAVAGIGNPERFFQMLEDYGLRVNRHPFPDHHPFCAEDLRFGDTMPVFMTEKDAVKCYDYADNSHWFVPVNAHIDERILPLIIRAIGKSHG